MIWWYRNVFIDRSIPLTGAVSDERQQVSPKPKSRLKRSLVNLLSWSKGKLQGKLKSHYDWKVYKNLSDHQLEDIGLTRDGLHLLLHNKTPVLPQQRVETVKKLKVVSPSARLIRDSDLEKTLKIPRDIVCSNDCGEKVA